MHSDFVDPISQLTSELENFEEIASYLIPKPGDLPLVRGMDIHGGTLALNGSVGGDLLIFLDFKQRFDLEARIQDNIHKGRLDIVDLGGCLNLDLNDSPPLSPGPVAPRRS